MFQFGKRRLTGKQPATAQGAEVTKSWADLSIRRFFDLQAIPEGEDYDLRLVSVLTATPVDVLEAMPLSEFMEKKAAAAWIKAAPLPDIVERERYVIDGGPGPWYCFRVDLDIKKWTTSQYIDYQNLGGKTDTPEELAAVLSCYLVPLGHTYGDGYDFDKLRAWLVDNFPALDAFALHNFFMIRSLRSISSIKTCWGLTVATRTTKPWKIRRQIKRLQRFPTAGAGSPSSTPLPRFAGCPGRRFLVWELSRLSIRTRI